MKPDVSILTQLEQPSRVSGWILRSRQEEENAIKTTLKQNQTKDKINIPTQKLQKF